MSRNFYAEINLHMVWHIKLSQPLLTPDIEKFTHHYLRDRMIDMPGVFVHEIGGIETHVHFAVSILPTVLISEMVGLLKGSSSHETNKQFGHKVLEWQAGYGVVSFGTKDLEWVKAYIRNQREHHNGSKIHDRLERIDSLEEQPAEA